MSELFLRKFFSQRLLCVTVLCMFSLSSLFCGPPKPQEVPGEVRSQAPVPPYARLAEQLNSPVWNVRSNTILEILRGEYRESIPRLLALLQNDEHPAVRQTAALALGEFRHKPAGPIIGRMIQNDPDVDTGFLIDALIRMGDSGNASYVVPVLESEQHVLRLKAVEFLGAVQANQQAARILGMAQKNRDNERARTYAMALGAVQAKAAGPYLIELARQNRNSPGPTLAAAYLALGRTGSVAGVPVLIEALSAEFAKGRENAVAALIQIKSTSALDPAFGLLQHERRETRYAAAEVIAGIPAKSSGPRALELLRRREERSVGPAAFVIARLKYDAARSEVETQLSERASPEREALARTLGWLGHKDSVPLLITVLSENDGEGRYGAAWSLGVIGDERALAPLRAAARSSDAKLARYASEALGGLASPQALPDLYALVEQNSPARYAALDAIALTPGSQSHAMLAEFALSSDLELQLAALRALGQRREQASIDVLMQVVHDGSTEAARSAMAALRLITELPYENRSQWKHWHEMR